MTDTLFEIPETTPKWQELADIHGIICGLREPDYLPPIYVAEIEWFGKTESEQGESKREAVIALIHRLKLEGWKTISL
jgi:hypothetical protein